MRAGANLIQLPFEVIHGPPDRVTVAICKRATETL
jgi:hypothetical protein